MSGVILYNCLSEIIHTIREIAINNPEAQYIWGGNSKNVPLVNEALKLYDVQIDCVIDNDKQKWNKEVGEVFPSEYFKKIIPGDTRKVYIYNPYDVIDLSKKQIYIIVSRYAIEIKEQLISAGIKEEKIYIFEVGVEVKDSFIKSELVENRLREGRQLGLREKQLLELEILKQFRDFCDENGLKYYLAYGTLLGAIRHKGFIPWDDDVDVYMPHEDYEKFTELYSQVGRCRLLDWKIDDNYFLSFGKLIDNSTCVLHPGYPVQACIGVYIDIFPLGGYGDGCTVEDFWQKNILLNNEWNDFYAAKNILSCEIQDVRYEINKERYHNRFEESNIVGDRIVIDGKEQWCVRREVFDNIVKVEFEGEFFNAPAGYDELLTVLYGDYMKIPPENERAVHMFESYYIKRD